MRKVLFLSLVGLLSIATVSCVTTGVKDFKEASSSGFTSEVDESGTRGQLSRVTTTDMSIRWRFAISPDHKSVIFSGKSVGSADAYQLYRLDLGSSAPVKLTAGEDFDAWDPSYTADGKYIVYRTGNNFWKIKSDGSGAKIKVPNSGLNRDYDPQVSGQDRVVFTTFDPTTLKSEIWTVGLDGSNLTQYREGESPMWSPDGSKIAFAYSGDIWIMNSDGTQLTQLTSTKDIFEGIPSFSPDGSRIVFVSNEGDRSILVSNPDIWTISIDGTEKTQVTALNSWDSWPVWDSEGIYFLSGRGKGDRAIARIWRIKQ